MATAASCLMDVQIIPGAVMLFVRRISDGQLLFGQELSPDEARRMARLLTVSAVRSEEA